MTRRLRWLAVGLPLLAVAGSVAVCEWLEWPFLRDPIERSLSEAAGRKVRFGGDFGIRLIGSVRVRSDELRIEQPVDDSRPFLNVTKARLVLPYATVWRIARGQQDSPPHIRLLEVESLEASLRRTADGKVNWTFGDPDAAPRDAPPPLPRFDRLVVGSGDIRVRDAVNELQIDAKLRTHEGSGSPNEGPDRPTPGSSHGAGGESPPEGLTVEASGKYRDAPLRATLKASGVLPLASSGPGAQPVPVELELRSGETRLDFDGRVTDLLHLEALEGEYRLSGPSLAEIGSRLGLTLPTTETFDMKGSLAKRGSQWSTEMASLSIGSSRLNGSFRFDPGSEVPKLSGTLRGERLVLSDLGPALGRGTGKTAEKAPAKSGERRRVLPAREFDIPSLAAMDADVALDLGSVELGSDALAPLTPLKARLTLDNSVLAVADLVAVTASGELRGLIRMDATRKIPHWELDIRVANLQLEQFIKARSAAGGKKDDSGRARPVPYIGGVLGGRAKMRGDGRSTAAMLASLSGSSDFWIRKGRISQLLLEMSGIDVAESLGLMISGDGQLPMNCAVARLGVKDGLATPEVAVIDTVDTTLLITGELSFAEERLGLLLTARPKDVSPITLRAPVHVEGSFADPKVRLDVASTALRLGAAAALAAIAAPAAALLALIDLGEEDKVVCADLLKGARARRGTAEAAPQPRTEGEPSR